jgi:hypothetical protein
MKAIVLYTGAVPIKYKVSIRHNDEELYILTTGPEYDYHTLCEIADQFNSALSQHVQSAISAKIELIEKEFTDKKIRELNPIWVRDEIIKRLKSGH